MKLIAFVGFAGSGKDTAANYLVENHNFVSFSFAESLKDTLSTIFCWDRELLSGSTGESRIWRETVDTWWSNKLGIHDFTPRKALQYIGTDLFRNNFHPDIWIHNIERKITLLPDDSNIVMSDGRFPNELNLCRRFGGKTIRVKRGSDPEWFNVANIANGMGELPQEENSRNYLIISALKRMEEEFKVHKSEWAWIGQPLDKTIYNDGSLNDLYDQVKKYCL